MEWPEEGEIVVIKITKVLPYGAFAELLEYEGLTGFIHISQVASGWVKNIRNFVRPNQMRAAYVLRVEPKKHQIDLSLTKLSQAQEREKITAWQLTQRAKKLLEVFAKKHKLSFDKAWKLIAEPLLERHESLMEAFQRAVLDENVLNAVPSKYRKELQELLKKSIQIPEKRTRFIITLKSYDAYGVDHIKKIFSDALKEAKKINANMSVSYAGGGKYLLVSSAPDYKTAGRNAKLIIDKILNLANKHNMLASYKEVEE